MGVILLEAAGALVLLVLIVWWTMFSGRDKGEPRRPAEPGSTDRDDEGEPPSSGGAKR